jgi:hypothetical protein
MRDCPQCARKNKPRAKFCDQCGFSLVGDAGSATSTQRADPPATADRLPPEDTAKGVAPAQAGVPREIRAGKGVYRQTQKLNAPVVTPGTPTDRSSHNHETVKVARAPAPVKDKEDAAPAMEQAMEQAMGQAMEQAVEQVREDAAPGAAPGAAPDPEPEATIQGAFYLRKQEAVRAASDEEHVGWLVVSVGSSRSPGAIWPVTAGITLIGSSQADVGPGVVVDRPGLAPVHALVFHRSGQTWLVDLDSGGGTALNGAPLPPLQGHLLAERDELHLGELILSFHRVDPQHDPGT